MYAPGRIADLIDALRGADWRVGPDQNITVYKLLLALASRGELPVTGPALSAVLRPVLCKTREEQERFHLVFDPWFARVQADWVAEQPAPTKRGIASVVTRPAAATGGAPAPSAAPPPLQTPRGRLALAIGGAILAAAVIVALRFLPTPEPPAAAPEPVVPEVPATRAPSAAGSVPRPAAPAGEPVERFWGPVIHGFDRIRPGPVYVLGGALALALAATLTPSLYLRRRHGSLPGSARTLSLALDQTARQEYEQSLPVLDPQTAALLVRHRAGERMRLDLRRTITATVRNYGVLSLRHLPVRERPGYVALVDVAHAGDQVAAWYRYWIEHLRAQELQLSVYTFSRDPRWLVDRRTGGQIAFDSLRVYHRGERLLVFSDGAGLYDAGTGALNDWVRDLQFDEDWKERVLFTPVDPYSWGRREQVIETDPDCGLMVLPVSAAGLAAYADEVTKGSSRLQVSGAARPMPPILRDPAVIYADERPPDPEVVERLMAGLKGWLEPAGFMWLAACAVLPMVRWELTLLIAGVLFEEGDDRAVGEVVGSHVGRLVQLPWLRRGSMPDWLRLRLLAELPREREQRVREAVRRALEEAVPGGDLVVVREGGPSRAEAEGDGLGEYLYVGFMSGLSGAQLALRAPASWARMLEVSESAAGRVRAAFGRIAFVGGNPQLGARAGFARLLGGTLGGVTLAVVGLGLLPPATFPGAVQDSLYERTTDPVVVKPAGGVKAIAFSPDGKLLALGGDSPYVTLWDVAAGETRARLEGHRQAVRDAVFSPDGGLLATADQFRTVILWDVASAKSVATLDADKVITMNQVAFSPDGKFVVAAGGFLASDTLLVLWDRANPAAKVNLEGHKGAVNRVAFSPDGRLLASAGQDGKVMLWDVPERRLSRTLDAHTKSVNDIAFSPDGRLLASGGADGKLVVWDVASGKALETLRHEFGAVMAVAFSPDGGSLAYAGRDGTVIVWDVARRGVRARLFGHESAVGNLAFSPDGTLLASGSEGGRMILFGVADGAEVAELTGHRGGITRVSFSPDGKLLASASAGDGTARLWEAKRSAAEAPATVIVRDEARLESRGESFVATLRAPARIPAGESRSVTLVVERPVAAPVQQDLKAQSAVSEKGPAPASVSIGARMFAAGLVVRTSGAPEFKALLPGESAGWQWDLAAGDPGLERFDVTIVDATGRAERTLGTLTRTVEVTPVERPWRELLPLSDREAIWLFAAVTVPLGLGLVATLRLRRRLRIAAESSS